MQQGYQMLFLAEEERIRNYWCIKIAGENVPDLSRDLNMMWPQKWKFDPISAQDVIGDPVVEFVDASSSSFDIKWQFSIISCRFSLTLCNIVIPLSAKYLAPQTNLLNLLGD
jgi:hypothetical protein